MKIEVTTKLDNVSYKFMIDEADAKEALHKAIVLGNPPLYCNSCQNTEGFRLGTNKDKEGNIYINTICCACGSKAKMGTYKTGGFFWHKFEKYVPKTQAEPNTQEGDW